MAEEKKKTTTEKVKNSNSSKKKVEETKVKSTKKVDTKPKKEQIKEEIVKEEKKEETVKNTDSFMKKHLVDVILIVAAVAVVIIGIVGFANNSSKENYLVELNYSQYEDMIKSGEKFAFIVESANCSHCKSFMPVVKKFVNKNSIYVYYIDLTTLSDTEYQSLLSSNSFFKENSDNWGTPTTMIMTGDQVSDTLVGESTETDFEAFLKENGIME